MSLKTPSSSLIKNVNQLKIERLQLPLLYRISTEVAKTTRYRLFINFDQKRRSELEGLRKLLHQLVNELEKLEEDWRRFSVAVFSGKI